MVQAGALHPGPMPESRLGRVVTFSLLLHAALLALVIVLAGWRDQPEVMVPVFEVVRLDRPRLELRRPIVQPVEEKKPEEPVKKAAAPMLVREPSRPAEKKKLPEKVEVKQDSVPVEQVVEEATPPPAAPVMVSENQGDPRLRFWFARVQKIVQNNWNPPRGIGVTGVRYAGISFVVKRDGGVVDVGLGESSGNRYLDEVAQNTLVRVGSVPPIPPNYQDKDELSIKFLFYYSGD